MEKKQNCIIYREMFFMDTRDNRPLVGGGGMLWLSPRAVCCDSMVKYVMETAVNEIEGE